MSFWENALPLLKEKKVKQSELVRLTGRAKSTVWNWFERKTIPAADDALKIADYLGVSVRYLVTGEDDRELSPREKGLLDLCSVLQDDKFQFVLDMAKLMHKNWEQEAAAGSYSPGSKEA